MPLIGGFDDESILSAGHLGIVADAYDSLGIAGVINCAIFKTRHHLTHTQVAKALVLNGLGFIERRLYLFPDFLTHPGASDDHGALPLHLFYDRVSVEEGTGTIWRNGHQPGEGAVGQPIGRPGQDLARDPGEVDLVGCCTGQRIGVVGIPIRVVERRPLRCSSVIREKGSPAAREFP